MEVFIPSSASSAATQCSGPRDDRRLQSNNVVFMQTLPETCVRRVLEPYRIGDSSLLVISIRMRRRLDTRVRVRGFVSMRRDFFFAVLI